MRNLYADFACFTYKREYTSSMQSGPEQMRDWMRRRGFNQADAARYLEYSESLMSRVMSGEYNPGLRNAVHLERLTGIPVEAWMASELDEAEPAVAAAAGKRKLPKVKQAC